MPNNPTQAISEVREALSKIPAPDFPRPAWWAERVHDAWSQVNEGHAFRRRMVADCVPHHLAPLIAAMNPDNARIIVEDHDRLTKIVNAPRGTSAQVLKERELTCSAVQGAIAFGVMGAAAPPEDTHWLKEFHDMGRHIAALTNALEQCFDFPPEVFDIPDGETFTMTVTGRHLKLVRAAISRSTT